VSRSDEPTAEDGTNEALGYWWITNNGTVGKVFKTMSPGVMDSLQEGIKAKGRSHRYEVVGKQETADQVTVDAEYCGIE
jgi:hypothetical protein